MAPNFKKTMEVAAQWAMFMGFIIDTNTMRLYVPKDGMDKLEAARQQLLAQDDEASARELASVAGRCRWHLQSLQCDASPARLTTSSGLRRGRGT